MFDFLNEKDRQPPTLPQGTVRRRYSIEGQVQGVGFRYRARYAAQSLGLTGWVEKRRRRLGHTGSAGRPDPLP